MGRRADPPALQKAKGNPGRRKSAVTKRIEEADRVAELLSRAPDGNDPLAPPAIIDGQGTAAAIAVWRELAPRLAKTHRLQAQHRPLFATFCVYFAEWVIANEDIGLNGHTQRVKTVAGGMMERIRPIVAIRDRALDRVLELSKRFGLTPSDEYSLFKDQAIAAANNPGLFDSRPQAPPSAVTDAEQGAPPAPAGPIGAMGGMDSLPPGSRPN